MNIKINIRQLGSKKAKIAEADFFLENTPVTVRELILEAVKTCVSDYNKRVRRGENNERPLLEDEIAHMSEIGKIAFGINYGGKEQDLKSAQDNALQCYEDGIVRIFVGEAEAGSLDERITLSEGGGVTFIKLAMLSGRIV